MLPNRLCGRSWKHRGIYIQQQVQNWAHHVGNLPTQPSHKPQPTYRVSTQTEPHSIRQLYVFMRPYRIGTMCIHQERPWQLFQPLSKEEQRFQCKHNGKLAKAHVRLHGEQRTYDEVKVNAALKPMNAKQKRAIMREVEDLGKLRTSWQSYPSPATTLTYLLYTKFYDALALCYHKPSLKIPAHMYSDDCWAAFSLEHALDCKKGGLVTQRHNEVRDALGDIASLAYREATKEPEWKNLMKRKTSQP